MEKEQKYQRPSWDEYFMDITKIIGERGTCDRCRGGCVIVKDKRIVATGYIGSPIGAPHCDDEGHEMNTVTKENGQQSRHCIRTTHAEQNAICQAARVGTSIGGGTLYTRMTPCYVCGKMIVNAGIKRVICEQDYHGGARSKEIFKQAKVEFVLLNDIMTTYADMSPDEKKFDEKNRMPDVKKEIINETPETVKFKDTSPQIKSVDDEPNQFIFENIPTN